MYAGCGSIGRFEDDVELAARIAVALEGFWAALSPFEGARRFGVLLERAEGLPYGVRAGCWRCLASSNLIAGGRTEDGISKYERSLDLYRRAGDERGIAIILNVWASTSVCSATRNAGAR